MSPFESPTQLAGFLAFLCASVTVILLGPDRRWLWVGFFHVLFATELLSNLRHNLRLPVNDILQAFGIYGDRIFIQVMLIGLLLTALMMLLVRLIVRNIDSSQASWRLVAGMAVTIMLLGLFGIELLSLHLVDGLLYAIFGKLMVITWIWLLAAAMVMLLVVLDRQSQLPDKLRQKS